MSLQKHRDESETMAIEFANRLNSGESLVSVSDLRIHDKNNADVSDQFNSPSGVIVGTTVQFTPGKATSSSDQAKGLYTIFCQVVTDLPQTMVETPTLLVTDKDSVT